MVDSDVFVREFQLLEMKNVTKLLKFQSFKNKPIVCFIITQS